MPRFAKYEENEEPISGYRLVDFLGAGQFGEVWKAVDTESGIFTAIKIIDLSHSSSALKELKALNLVRNLRHPNLVPIFTARLKDRNGKEHALHKAEEVKQKGQLRELIIAMGLGDHSLSARLKQLNPDGTDPAEYKGIPVEELIPYMEGAARGIDYLNRKDHGLPKGTGDGPIIHCDIKPDNMMIVAGEVQIADCGVAVIITPDARQTKAAGSPAYSAPELTGNKPVPGTDQYALAISYFELRTGKLPFDESMGQLSIMLAHAEGRLDFDSSPVLSDYEKRVLKWATAVQPKLRYQSCMDMVKQLSRAQYDLPPLAPDQLGSKSGVVSVPPDRSKTGPGAKKLEPPKPAPAKPKEKDKPTDEYRAVPAEDLRGTVIPDSDRMLPPSQAHLTLPPADTGKGGSKTDTKPNNVRGTLMPDAAAKYGASQSDILVPPGNGDYTSDEDFDPDAPAAPTTAKPTSAANMPADLAASLIVERPQISVDSDDPLGAQHRTIELDDEIKKILRQNTPVHTPAARLPVDPPPTGGPRLPSNPVIVPPVSPGKRSTQYPRETPPTDDDDAKSPPPWAKESAEEKSLPPWAKEAEIEKARSQTSEYTPASSSNNWKEAAPPPAKSGGLPAKLLIGGVLVGGLAVGGFLVLGKPSVPPPPSSAGNELAKVNPALINAIDAHIDAKQWPDAETALAALPADAVYNTERQRLASLIAKGKAEPPTPMGVDPTKIKPIEDRIAQGAKGDLAALDEAETLRAALPSKPEYDLVSAKLANAIAQARVDAKAIVAAKSKAEITTLLANPTLESLDKAESLLPNLRSYFDTEAAEFAKKIAAGRKGLADLILIKDLATLEKVPAAEFPSAAENLQKKTSPDKDKQALFVKRLIAIGEKDPTLRPAILSVITKGNAFATLVEYPSDREVFFKWKVTELEAPYSAALKAIQDLAAVDEPRNEVVTAAQNAVSMFGKAVTNVGTPFGTVWVPAAVPAGMREFQTVAETWSSAHYRPAQELTAFAEYFKPPKLATPPTPAAPFAMEFLRLGTKRALPVASLRAVRDQSLKWANVAKDDLKRIDDLYQNALALHLHEGLGVLAPDWAKLKATADKDHGHGWAALAQAEQKFTEKEPSATVLALVAEGEKHTATKDPTAAARAVFAKYLRGVVGRDPKTADELAELFQPTTPEILNFPPRAKAAGEWLHDSATTAEKIKLSLGDILGGNWKVYPRDDKALNRLVVADKLAGKSHPDWPLKLSLMAIACDRPDVATAASGRVDLDALPGGSKNEDLLAGLAFCLKRAKTAGQATPSDRAAAYAAAARLAIRAVEYDFDDCKTSDESFTKEAARYRRIQTEVVDEGLKLSPGARDRVSLDFSKLHTDPANTTEGFAALVSGLDRMANEIGGNHPDRVDYCSLRAFATLARFSPKSDLGSAADESTREQQWSKMIGELDEALRIDPNHGLGNRIMAYVIASEFGSYLSYPPPKARTRKAGQYAANLEYAKKGVGHFDKAAAAMTSRKNNVFWKNRGDFLRACGTDFAMAGEPTNEVKTLFAAALDSINKADSQRDKQRYDELRLIGCISEDLAWLTGTDAKKNYAAALDHLKTSRNTVTQGEQLEGLIDRGRVTIRSVRCGEAPASALETAASALGDEKLTGATGLIPAKAQYWLGALHRTAGDADKADDAYAKAIRGFADATPATEMHAWAYAHRAENALDSRPKATLDAAKVAADAIAGLSGLIDGNSKVFSPTMSFVPDYLKGRAALATEGPAAAARHFQAAFATLDATAKDRSLRIEDPFAFHCLAYELDRCGERLSANDKAKRLALLTDLETRFKWAMNDDDRKLVAQAKSKAK